MDTSDAVAFTLNKLAQALRGMPRDGRMLIRLPDGGLVDIDHVTAAYVGDDDKAQSGPGGGGQYGIILVADGSSDA